MEQWSILSNVINYMQYSKNPKNFHSMTIRPVKFKNRSIGPELTTAKTGPIHLSSLVEIAFVD